jgi:hypothetical protein
MAMKRTLLGAALAGLLILAGCDYLPFGFTPVKEIVSSPARFEGKEIRIKGKVKDILKVSLIDLKAYVLDDGSGGVVAVIARDSLPEVNQTVTVRGVVESMAIVGGQSIGLRIKEIRRL